MKKTRKKDIEWGKVVPLMAITLGIALFAVVFVMITYRMLIGIEVGGLMAYLVTEGGKYGMLYFILFSSALVLLGALIISNSEAKKTRENSSLW